MTVSQLQAVCKTRELRVYKKKGSSSIVKDDYVATLTAADNPSQSHADDDTLASLASSSNGPSAIHQFYTDSFKPIDIADQYKASITNTTSRKVGDAKHIFTLQLLLAEWVNLYAVSHEKTANQHHQQSRLPLKAWVLEEVKNRKQRRDDDAARAAKKDEVAKSKKRAADSDS